MAWYCSYPEMWEYHYPAMLLPVDDVQIKSIWMIKIGLGNSTYTKIPGSIFKLSRQPGTREAL
jgi:hypothetical protein